MKPANLNKLTRKGFLICFEGLDRSGKGSNIDELKTHFEQNHKREVEIIRFPGNPHFF